MIHNRLEGHDDIADQWNDDPEQECGDTPFSGWRHMPRDWSTSLHVAIGRLLHAIHDSRSEAPLIDDCHKRLEALEGKVEALPASNSIIVPITTFAPEPFEVLREIKVVLQPCDEEFVASFFDANVGAQGCNQQEAIDNLKDLLLSRFDYLEKMPTERLGKSTRRQIQVLREFIRRKS